MKSCESWYNSCKLSKSFLVRNMLIYVLIILTFDFLSSEIRITTPSQTYTVWLINFGAIGSKENQILITLLTILNHK